GRGGEGGPRGVMARGRGGGGGGAGGSAGTRRWWRPGRRIREGQPCHHGGSGGAQAAAQRDVGTRADRAARVAHAVRRETGAEGAGEDVVVRPHGERGEGAFALDTERGVIRLVRGVEVARDREPDAVEPRSEVGRARRDAHARCSGFARFRVHPAAARFEGKRKRGLSVRRGRVCLVSPSVRSPQRTKASTPPLRESRVIMVIVVVIGQKRIIVVSFL